MVTEKPSRFAALMPALLQWMLPLRVWSTVAAIAVAIYQWIRALPLWSQVAAVVADPLRPLRIRVVRIAVFAGYLLSLRPSWSWVGPLPRPFRCASPRSFGGDSAVLAAKRGERPPTGARLGGGGVGGTSSTTASSAGKSPDPDAPKAAAASAIPEPIIPALLATGSAIYMMINKAPAPALTMKLFFVSVLLASVAVVKAEGVRHPPRRKADGTAMEHAIDVPIDLRATNSEVSTCNDGGRSVRANRLVPS